MGNQAQAAFSKPFVMRGGRLTKFKGVVASYAPCIGIALATVAMAPHEALSQTLSWDGAGATANGSVEGGTGTWDAATQNWTSDGGTTNEAWAAGSKAIFGGTAGTVTVSGTQDVQNITFDTDGYVVTGGALTYTDTDADPATTAEHGIHVTLGTATIASSITSTTGLTKTGNGELVLSGTNSITGVLDLQRGTLTATNPDALTGVTDIYAQSANSAIRLDLGGASLTVNSVILNAPGTSTFNNGTLNLTGTAQIGFGSSDFVFTGAGELRKLLPYTFTLNGQSTLTGPVNVLDGRLIVSSTGSILNAGSITIDLGATLEVDGFGGNALSDAILVQNDGTLELSGSDETIGAIQGAGNITLNDNTLTFGDGTNRVISGDISGSGDLNYDGTAVLTLSGSSTMTGDIRNSGGGTINLTGSTAGGVTNATGTFNNQGTIGGAVSNSATFNNLGTLNGTFTNNTGATLNSSTGAVYNGDVINNGDFNITSTGFSLNGTLTNSGNVTNQTGSMVTLTIGADGNFSNRATLDGGAGGITLSGGTLTLNSGNSLVGTVVLDVDALVANIDTDIQDTTSYDLTNNATATVVADADFSGGDLMNIDTLNVSGGDLVGVGLLSNAGIVNIGDGTARLLEADSVANNGTINVNDGSTLRGTGNTTNNAGIVNVNGNGTLEELAGDYNNLTGGSVNFNDADPKTFDVQTGIITNAGDLNFNDGATTVNSAGGAIENSGTITVASTATMDASGDTIENSGTVETTGTLTVDTLTNDAAGIVEASGTLNGDVTNLGSFEATGALIHTGDIDNTGSGVMTVTAGTMSTSGSVENNGTVMGTSLGTAGINIAGGAELSAGTFTNFASSSVYVAGTLSASSPIANSGTLTSVGTLSGGLSNSGTATVSGDMEGAVQNNAGGQLNIAGDLVMNSTLTNASGGQVDVDAGTVTGLTTLNNSGGGTGTGAGAAGFEIDEDAVLNVQNVSNFNGATMFVAGTLNSATVTYNLDGATFTSVGSISGSFQNDGLATLRGEALGGLQNFSGGQLIIDGDLDTDGVLANTAGGLVDIDAGTVTGITTLTNESTGSGVQAGQAGFEIASGAVVNAVDVNNNGGTMFVAGTLNSTNAVTNSGVLTLVGELYGGLTNTNFANLEGTLGGVLTNDGGNVAITDDLSGTGDVFNVNSGQIAVATGRTFSFATLENDSTSVIGLNGATLVGNVTNAGLIGNSGTITGNLANTGTLVMANSAVGDTITVNGTYTGGGAMSIDVDFVTDTADRLIVNGDVTGGTTLVSVSYVDPGIASGDDIVIASVSGTSFADAFALATPINIGALSYGIEQNGMDYVLGTGLVAEVAGIEPLAFTLLQQSDLPSLRQRSGLDGRWTADVPDYGWFIAEGSVSRFAPASSGTSFRGDMNEFRLMGGLNFDAYETGAGRLMLGVSLSYGSAQTTVSSDSGPASISSDAYSVGLSATWYGASGIYVDGQLQYTVFDAEMSADGEESTTEGEGYSAAVEVGKRLSLANSDWSVTPQGRLEYATVDYDDFTSGGGLSTSLESAESLQVGLGLTAERAPTGETGSYGPYLYGSAFIYRELAGDISIDVAGTSVTSQAEEWTGEIGLGIRQTSNNGLASLFGEVSYASGFRNPSENSALSIAVGGEFSF